MKHSPNPHLLQSGRMSCLEIKNRFSMCSRCTNGPALDDLIIYYYPGRYLAVFDFACISKFRIYVAYSCSHDCLATLLKNTHSKQGLLIVMCPKATNLNYVQQHTQCCLTEAVFNTIDDDNTISNVKKGIFGNLWSYKVMFEATTRYSKGEQRSNTT